MHLYRYVWMVNPRMQMCWADLSSESHETDTSAPILPAGMQLSGNALFAFGFGKPPGFEQQSPVHLHATLDPSMQNQSPFAGSLFCAMPAIHPFSACPVAHESNIWMTATESRKDWPRAFILIVLWDFHDCRFSPTANNRTLWSYCTSRWCFLKASYWAMLW